MATNEEIWGEVERQLAMPLPPEVRALLEKRCAWWFRRYAAGEVSEAQLVGNLVDFAWDLKGFRLWPGEVVRALEPEEPPSGGRHQERWLLWRALRDRLAELRGVPGDEPPWTPFRFALDRERNHVVFSFDQRLGDKAVRGRLKNELPKLRALGWRRETRSVPQENRGLALVRYVCLESPVTATWRERTAGWLASRYVKEHPAWGKAYQGEQGPRRFEEDFHEAEAALAGPQVEFTTASGERMKTQHALTVLYDGRVQKRFRQVQEIDDQAERALAGDRAAQEAEVAAVRKALGNDGAERLQLAFQADAEIEALVAKAKGGVEGAAEEAQRRVDRGDSHWTPEELRRRLPQLARRERPPGEEPLDDFEVRKRFIAERKAALKEELAAALRERLTGTGEPSESPTQLRCVRCAAWVPLHDSVLGHCLDCAHALAGE